MNCEHVTNRLAEGKPLDAAALDHVAACPSCRSLLAAMDASEGSLQPLDPNRLSAIRDRLAAAAQPVHPLPSDRILVTLLLGILFAFIFIVGATVHMAGLRVLTPLQMTVYFGLLLVCAVGGAVVFTGEMIPGSRLRLQGGSWVVATAVVLTLACLALFRSYDTEGFIHLGLHCLVIGSVSALAAGVLLSLFLRRGFLAFQRSAARITGFFAALAGVAVLALHCPNLSVMHILVWHFGVLLLGWLAGDLVGRRLEAR